MTKAVIEHDLLDSKIATASALFSEWIKWCEEHNISSRAMSHITDAYRVPVDDK